jgi:3-dehydroquinate synthase
MPRYQIDTSQRIYSAIIERGCISLIPEYIPEGRGKIFVVTTADVWKLHRDKVERAFADREFEVIFFVGGEENKRFSHVEKFAGEMMNLGADRSSLIVAFGGGIVTDMAGFLAAIFMRGVPVIQIPTTLLAQVDAAVGGKTGVNLDSGKNLIGSFHQPLVVLTDPNVLATLPEREYRAGLFEIIKAGIISSPSLFTMLAERKNEVLAQNPDVVDRMIAEAVHIKAQVVTRDERESDRRRILNLGHTFGHALEAETKYSRFLHGEAVAWGMRAAVYLADDLGMIGAADRDAILDILTAYGPIPGLEGINRMELQIRLMKDKKTVQNRIHFILPVKIGEVTVVSDVNMAPVQNAIERALADCRNPDWRNQ